MEDKMKKMILIIGFLSILSVLNAATINIPADYATIQLGINAASNGDIVLAQPGTYVENINYNGKNITVASLYLTTQDISYISQTIIDGGNLASVVKLESGEDSTAVLTGFTITNGNSTGNSPNGGGIYISGSDVVIDNVIISDNSASGAGGGMYLYNSDPVLNEVIISNNNSTYEGGGIMCFNSNPVLEYVTIYENSTEWSGGGICSYMNSEIVLENVTIADNVAFQNGSGIASFYGSDVTLLNSIVWDNPSEEIYVHPDATLNATYSDIKDGAGQTYFGTGCIDGDPLFADQANNDYQITWANFPDPDSSKSPCIDTGDPDVQYNDPDGTRNDMGAYYFPQSGIQGTITLSGGSGNVQNVIVSAISATDTTTTSPDENGAYVVSVIPGTYTVIAVLDGYSGNPVTNVIVSTGQVTTGIDIQLDEVLPGSINGEVALEGLGDVTSVLISAGGVTTNPYFVATPPHYEYDLEIIAGTYDVVATLPGYYDSTRTDIVVQSGQLTTDVDFTLLLIHYDGYIAGNVTLKEGIGNVENVEISAGTITEHPDSNGYYVITINNGTYDLTASLDDYATLTFESVVVIADDTTEVDITLMNWEVITGTQFVMSTYITTTLDGAFIDGSNSNQLAAFGPGGDCRGIASWYTGSHLLWDESYHYWPLDGYWYCTIVSNDNSGEAISFKVYDTETDSIYSPSETLIFVDCTCDNVVDLYAPSPSHDFEFDLIEEWNWISFNLEPPDNSVATVFDDLTIIDPPNIDPYIHQVSYGKQLIHSAQYWAPPVGWIPSSPSNLSVGDGLKVNMNHPYDNFIFSGTKLNPIMTPIELFAENVNTTGYNWIAYIPQNSLPLEEALVSINVANGTCIKTQNQSAVYDGGWVGDLTHMYPGISYIILMSADDVLTYPANTVADRSSPPIVETSPNYANWELLSGTSHNMIVMAKLLNNDNIVLSPEEYAVGIFDEDNACHSIGKYVDDFWYFTVVGNDETANLHFRTYHNLSGITTNSDEIISYEKDIIIGDREESIEIVLKSIEHSDAEFMLYINHPNPFYLSTSIRYYIPESSHVELTIYNILGQKVKTLISTHQEVGEYTLTWNGLDENNNRLSSGIYFYKLTTGASSVVRKMLMVQ